MVRHLLQVRGRGVPHIHVHLAHPQKAAKPWIPLRQSHHVRNMMEISLNLCAPLPSPPRSRVHARLTSHADGDVAPGGGGAVALEGPGLPRAQVQAGGAERSRDKPRAVGVVCHQV